MGSDGFFETLKKSMSKKNIVLLILLFAAGILLVLISNNKKEQPRENARTGTEADFDTEAYLRGLEDSLEELLCKISGIGKVRVMLTAESTPEYVFLEDTSAKNGGTETSAVLSSKSSSVKEPVVKARRMPKINGAAVVCDGGGSAAVKEKVIGVVSSVLGLSSNRIYVTN